MPAGDVFRRSSSGRAWVVVALLILAAAVLATAAVLVTQPVGAHHPRALVPAPSSGPAHRARRSPRPTERRRLARDVHRILRSTSYISLGTSRRRDVALTFDDGPGAQTPALLRWLHRHHVPATFFVIGRAARAAPAVVRQEARLGDAVGDHTDDHAALASLAPALQGAEIARAARAIRRAGTRRPLLFRPPYGSFDADTLSVLHRRQMLMVLWTVDTKDFERPGVDRIVYIALSGARPGAIILMHDGGGNRSQTLAALPRIVHRLRQRRFRLVTVPQLIHDDPPPRHQPAPTPLAGGSASPSLVHGVRRTGRRRPRR